MSGNGAKVEQDGDKVRGDIVLVLGDLPSLSLPTGSGGGCVTSGPFKDMSVNLGPAALSLPGNVTVAQPNPLEYNPRCLKRDLTDWVNQRMANATAVLHTIKQQTIYDFQMIMQGIPGTGDIGIHGGGHYSLGKLPPSCIRRNVTDSLLQVAIQAMMFLFLPANQFSTSITLRSTKYGGFGKLSIYPTGSTARTQSTALALSLTSPQVQTPRSIPTSRWGQSLIRL